MKVYRYYLINLLILLAPLYGNWDLLSDGERCIGIVVDTKEINQSLFYETYPIINYQVGERFYQIKGPENADFPLGTKLDLIYPKDKPHQAVIFSLSGFLSQWYSILAIALLIFWNAFYLSFLKDKTDLRHHSKKNGKLLDQ